VAFGPSCADTDTSSLNMASDGLAALQNLDIGTKCQAEYMWIDGFGTMRSKGKSLDFHPKAVGDLPVWNFDGSSTGQAPGEDSEVVLNPRAMYKDPFRGAPNVLVMCDCYDAKGNPIPTNTRFECAKVMEAAKHMEPWFGVEQEYFLMKKDNTPLGFPDNGYAAPQGGYYCGIGAENVYGRDIQDAHWRACLYAGIKISGINGEVAPGQWEFQVGPAVGIEEGDMLWTARYILGRICEIAGVRVCFDPKPVKGDWNGSGCHTNFSTKAMRENGGLQSHILPAMKKLQEKHFEHIAVYGEGNAQRLTGLHETASMDSFSYGVANRGASVRIGNDTQNSGKGYFEDRRPASNMDPYLVTRMMVATCCDIPTPTASVPYLPSA